MEVYKKFLDLGAKFDKDDFLLVTYKLAVKSGEDFLVIAGGLAAESSVGTWTEVKIEDKKIWGRLYARVIDADEKSGIVKIAYPVALFEAGNIAQLLSSVAGNVFGLKELLTLRLLDLKLPDKYVSGFLGPKYGIGGLREKTGVNDRPFVGSIIKPKLGLTASEHVEVAKKVFLGGVDFVKDDENLTSCEFNNFYERVDGVLAMMKEERFLKKKIYAFNITADAGEMVKRAKYVEENGGDCVMVDILTCGFSAVEALRKKGLSVFIHGHRAMHGALTRGRDFGISMLVLAKLARLAGVDLLHSGTVVGKMEGEEKEVVAINEFLRSNWFGLKLVLPVASGGLYPGLVPDLVRILGKEMMFNFGGGIHGHSQGSECGARAVLQAVEAVVSGFSLKDYARKHEELKKAIEKWGI